MGEPLLQIEELEATELEAAVFTGNMDLLKALIENGADVHARRDAALFTASVEGHTAAARVLLEAGADPHANNHLAWAVIGGHVDIVRLLLAAGADPHVRLNQSLRLATRKGNAAIVGLLLAAGANPNAVDDDSETILHHVADRA